MKEMSLIVASVSSVGAGRLLTRQNRFIFTLTPTKSPLHGYRPFSVNSLFYRQSLITPYAAFNVALISKT